MGFDEAGQAWCGVTRYGGMDGSTARTSLSPTQQVGEGLGRHGSVDGVGLYLVRMVRQARLGTVRFGSIWFGEAGTAWRDRVRSDWVRFSLFRQVRFNQIRFGRVRYGSLWQARLGSALTVCYGLCGRQG